MMGNKPKFESIAKTYGNSFAIKRFDQPCPSNLKFWHFHPEIEMAYIKNGHGRRHIGYHLSYFYKGDLVLIGSNLPHSGFSDRLSGKQEEFVIQMTPDFLGEEFFTLPEMQSIDQLIKRSKRGISFYGSTKKEIGLILQSVPDQSPFERLISLLMILQKLANSQEYQLLNADDIAIEVSAKERNRIDKIIEFVYDNYQRQITLQEVAGLVNLTETSFSRYFKEITGKTFIQFLNEYRLITSLKLIAENSCSISEVCFETGFNNYSHFTKQFKNFTGKTPREYRNELKHIVE